MLLNIWFSGQQYKQQLRVLNIQNLRLHLKTARPKHAFNNVRWFLCKSDTWKSLVKQEAKQILKI